MLSSSSSKIRILASEVVYLYWKIHEEFFGATAFEFFWSPSIIFQVLKNYCIHHSAPQPTVMRFMFTICFNHQIDLCKMVWEFVNQTTTPRNPQTIFQSLIQSMSELEDADRKRNMEHALLIISKSLFNPYDTIAMSNETKKLSWTLSTNGMELLRQIISHWDNLCAHNHVEMDEGQLPTNSNIMLNLLPQISQIFYLSLRHFATAGSDVQTIQLHLLIHMHNQPSQSIIPNWRNVIHIPITGLQSGSVKVRQLSFTALCNFCQSPDESTKLPLDLPFTENKVASLRKAVRSIMVDTISYLLIIRSPRVHSLRQAFCALFGV